jgi:flagellar hook-basal body complex protein FliE
MNISGITGSFANGITSGIGGPGGGIGGGLPRPNQAASDSDGATFGATLKSFVIDRPSEQKATAENLAMRLAAGEKIDPHRVAIESAKAGVEIQMATRTISQAVTAIRTLFQMQI